MTENDNMLVELTVEIVSSYVANNSVPRAELEGLISSVHGSLRGLGNGTSVAAPVETAALVPAVPVKKSVTPDAIICLEDGKAFKSLKRHLGTKYNLTPEAYRQKWNLPANYPMVAPNYAAQRSALAKTMGLGKGRMAAVEKVKKPAGTGRKPGRPRAS